MGPAYAIDLELGCIFIKWSGGITAQAVIAFNRDIPQDPNYRPGLDRLVDFRQAKYETRSSEIKGMTAKIIDERDAVEGDRKFALLAQGDFDFTLFQIIGSMTNHTGTDARPFQDMQEAMAWLQLPAGLGDPFANLTDLT